MVQGLTEAEAERLLDYINNLNDPDELTDEELAELAGIETEMGSGAYVTLKEHSAKYSH